MVRKLRWRQAALYERPQKARSRRKPRFFRFESLNLAANDFKGLSWLRAHCVLAVSLPSLMQLDHVAIGVAHEDRLRIGAEADGAAAQRDAGSFETSIGGHDVGAEQRDVRDPWVLLQIHQDVRCVRVGRIQDEVQFQAST
jgi:hypothetical protein